MRDARGLGISTFLLLATVMVTRPAVAQATDPFVGTWQLNVANSTFTGSSAPDARLMTFAAVENGLRHITVTRISPDRVRGVEPGAIGASSMNRVEYTARYDGQDYQIAGSVLSTVALRRIDANTIERTGKVGGEPSEKATWTLSADGRVLTITTSGILRTSDETSTLKRGTEYSSVQVFERR